VVEEHLALPDGDSVDRGRPVKDERLPLALTSQFQLPSGHCHLMSDRARSCARESLAKPIRHATARALPSCDAHQRVRPLMVFMFLAMFRTGQPVENSSAAARARGSPTRISSSTNEMRRQCAPGQWR
jgi:hypothetical protein